MGGRGVRPRIMPRVSPTPAAPGPRAWQRHAGYVFLSLFFAFADLRFIVALMPKVLRLSAEVADGVVRGEPLWRVYQSRVL